MSGLVERLTETAALLRSVPHLPVPVSADFFDGSISRPVQLHVATPADVAAWAQHVGGVPIQLVTNDSHVRAEAILVLRHGIVCSVWAHLTYRRAVELMGKLGQDLYDPDVRINPEALSRVDSQAGAG